MMQRLLILLFAGAGSVFAGSPPLLEGEAFGFRVAWGIFGNAGEIRIDASPAGDHSRITTTTATRGFLRGLFPFDARSEALYDAAGLLQEVKEVSESKKKTSRHALAFDYTNSRADFTDELRPDRNVALDLPPGQPLDLITSLINTRSWDLKPGEKQDALVIFDDNVYELTIHAEAYEETRTPMGRFKTLKLVPKMEKTEPKGMFKRGSTVSVWISQDGQRLPVRFEVEFKFGSGVATLIDYRKPKTSAANQVKPGS